jgi:hypothetical protein
MKMGQRRRRRQLLRLHSELSKEILSLKIEEMRKGAPKGWYTAHPRR